MTTYLTRYRTHSIGGIMKKIINEINMIHNETFGILDKLEKELDIFQEVKPTKVIYLPKNFLFALKEEEYEPRYLSQII
jgi:hypothetical protein